MAGEWSNLKQVARALDVHYMTAYRYVRQGRLAARWVDNGWQVHRDDVEAFRMTTTAVVPGCAEAPAVGWGGRLAPMLINGDESGSWAVIESALAAGLDAR